MLNVKLMPGAGAEMIEEMIEDGFMTVKKDSTSYAFKVTDKRALAYLNDVKLSPKKTPIGAEMIFSCNQGQDDSLPELPAFLYPIPEAFIENFRNIDSDIDITDMIDDYRSALNPFFDDTEIEEIVSIINMYVLPKRKSYFENLRAGREKFSHDRFAEAMIKRNRYATVEGNRLYYYANGYYKADPYYTELEKQMQIAYPKLKIGQRNEVKAYIRIMTGVSNDKINQDEYLVNCKNGLLHLGCEPPTFSKHTPEHYSFQQIPVIYDPKAPVFKPGEDALKRTFSNNQEVIDLFEEMLGVCLIRNLKHQKAFVFVGEGGCGKSTIIEMVENFIGKENYETLDLAQLQDRFSCANLADKLANFADDIEYQDVITNTGKLKRLIVGNEIDVERKGVQGYKMTSYATQIFSANGYPQTREMNYAMIRRFVFIPFTANFTKDAEGYDPDIINKLKSEECKTWLLNIAIRGLRRFMKNKHFTKPAVTIQAAEEWVAENSLVQEWVLEENITKEHVCAIKSQAVFEEFCDWCDSVRSTPVKINGFNKEIKRIFDVERSNPIIVNGVKGRFFR